jgi:hypothetical protein
MTSLLILYWGAETDRSTTIQREAFDPAAVNPLSAYAFMIPLVWAMIASTWVVSGIL